MTVALNQAIPIVRQIATIASRKSFRRQLVAAYPAMRDLLLSLRAGTPAMFEIMKRSYVQRGSLDSASGISADGLAALEKDRQMLAGWVVLMDKSLSAMDTAAAAALARVSPTDLAALSEASIEIEYSRRATEGDQNRAMSLRTSREEPQCHHCRKHARNWRA